MTHDELGKQLREAQSAMGDICDCGSIHGYVNAAGEAWKGGVINTEDYADALAEAWRVTRKQYLADRPAPTIAELEAILNSPDGAVNIMPDGSVMAARGMTAAEWNQAHRPGTGVIVKLDDGKLKYTRTRSEAWELGHGQPVVMVEGITGGYDLSRVKPMEVQDTPLA